MFDYIKIAENAIRSMQKESNSAPGKPPIFWKGIFMTVEEAGAVVRALETQKAKYAKRYRNTETGSRITEIAFDGTVKVLDATAKGLKANPLTALAGLVVGGVEQNVEALGETVSHGIDGINQQRNSSRIADIENCINALNELIKESID
ncbi:MULTISPECIES: hypothetical protein [Cyanophyceae]|uniref:Uncharacterized protein n=1 Tax=Leptolyngbya subtilissima DQ-A4 TaxID=2933933 RepID=A0ABV0JYJ3_9CYAN|nr:hypothetical protein [Nodosilinea sp. FACHB-141]MBD2112149.1 hypothetical protein [Nodosilinea sp. FACHB-141]